MTTRQQATSRRKVGPTESAISTPGSHSNNGRPFVELDGDTVAEGDNLTGIGGDTFARDHHAHKIQGISGGGSNGFAGGLLMPRGAQRIHGCREGEMLPTKAA